jgi:hypothetical protein
MSGERSHIRSVSQQSTSTSASTSTTTASSQRSPTLATRLPTHPPRPSDHEIVQRIISPGTILFEHRTRPQGLTAQQPTSAQTRGGAISRNATSGAGGAANMDRRNPSSFQQLEKVGIFKFTWWQRKANLTTTAGRGHVCHRKLSHCSPTTPSY